jgi:hypothetical protein
MLETLYILIADKDGNTPISIKVDFSDKEMRLLLDEPYLIKRLIADAKTVTNADIIKRSDKKGKGRTPKD